MSSQPSRPNFENHEFENHENFSSVIDEPDFAIITDIARNVFNVPYALITHYDGTHLTYTDSIEFKKINIPPEKSFCGEIIKRREIFIAEDTSKFNFITDNPCIDGGEDNFHFFAGAPLIFEDGEIYGTINIYDIKPRSFSLYERTLLKLMASQVVSFLKFHFQAKSFQRINQELEKANKNAVEAETILNTMHDGILVHDAQGHIIGSNPSACRILGFDETKLNQIDLKNSCWEFFDENNNPIGFEDQPVVVALREKRTVENVIIGAKRPDKGVIWLQISARPIFHEKHPQLNKVVASFTDITKERDNSEHLKELTIAAEQANKAKSNFLANMSHEIRTPLNGVIGVADALSRTSLDDSQKQMVDLINSSGKALEIILNDVLDLSKIEAGHLSMEYKPVDIIHCIGSSAKLIKIRADEKNIIFDVNFANGLKPYFIGDETRIRQVVLNLASNAVKFTERGGVTIDIAPLDDTDGFKVIVKDTGIGIDDEKIASIFSRFMQADETITRKFGGTGLGLAICRDLMQLMGGILEVESEVGKGTTFTAKFPLLATEAPINIQQLDIEEIDDDMTSFKILLVEDNISNQKVFQIVTEPLDFNITIANNGQEAVDIYQNQSFDFVFMDMQMPIMDGIQATKRIREIEIANNMQRCGIIMISANNSSNHIKLSKEAGADFFITKPFDLYKIIDAIEKLSEDPDLDQLAYSAA